jgi:hypothetical protein
MKKKLTRCLTNVPPALLPGQPRDHRRQRIDPRGQPREVQDGDIGNAVALAPHDQILDNLVDAADQAAWRVQQLLDSAAGGNFFNSAGALLSLLWPIRF